MSLVTEALALLSSLADDRDEDCGAILVALGDAFSPELLQMADEKCRANDQIRKEA